MDDGAGKGSELYVHEGFRAVPTSSAEFDFESRTEQV